MKKNNPLPITPSPILKSPYRSQGRSRQQKIQQLKMWEITVPVSPDFLRTRSWRPETILGSCSTLTVMLVASPSPSIFLAWHRQIPSLSSRTGSIKRTGSLNKKNLRLLTLKVPCFLINLEERSSFSFFCCYYLYVRSVYIINLSIHTISILLDLSF